MESSREQGPDLSVAQATAVAAAREWGLELGEPFILSYASFVAPAGRGVLKVSWEGDDESLDEGAALALWNGEGAVRLLRRSGRVLLVERAVPGDDLSSLPEDEATAIAVDIATRLWRRAGPPFRPVAPEIPHWLDQAEREGGTLVARARELLAHLRPGGEWLVHGDFHHHNILRHGCGFQAIDPKPYLADREYDLPSFLLNPLHNRREDREQTEQRIAAFVAAGLDDFRVRSCQVTRRADCPPHCADDVRGRVATQAICAR